MLALEPSSFPAHVNLGNIFFQTGQYAEASTYYRKALSERPDSVLALHNLHLAQSESFDFRGAEASLNRAREIDAGEIAALLSRKGAGERPGVVDARVGTGSILKATLGGSKLGGWLKSGRNSSPALDVAREFANPVTLVAALALLASAIALGSVGARRPASRCSRCGRPFCPRCKSGRESHDYCSQCLHLFVLGDGLAPETKTRKLYEIEQRGREMGYAQRLELRRAEARPILDALFEWLWQTRQTVAKALGRWRRAGWLITGRGRIMRDAGARAGCRRPGAILPDAARRQRAPARRPLDPGRGRQAPRSPEQNR